MEAAVSHERRSKEGKEGGGMRGHNYAWVVWYERGKAAAWAWVLGAGGCHTGRSLLGRRCLPQASLPLSLAHPDFLDS